MKIFHLTIKLKSVALQKLQVILKIVDEIFLERFKMNFYFDEDLMPSPMLVDPIYLSSDSEEKTVMDIPSNIDADDESSLATEK